MTTLDMGIIPLDRNLMDAFSTLSKAEIKTAKRKFRKLKKKALNAYNTKRFLNRAVYYEKYDELSSRRMKFIVKLHIDEEVSKRLDKKNIF